jgi:hypothetical protein
MCECVPILLIIYIVSICFVALISIEPKSKHHQDIKPDMRNIKTQIQQNQWSVLEKYLLHPHVIIKISYEDSDIMEYLYPSNIDKLAKFGYKLKIDDSFTSIKVYYLKRIENDKN